MGLTERHWFEDEEPGLTDRQLEDAVEEQKDAYRRGYQKGYSDGVKEQEAVEPVKQIEQTEWTVCGNCRNHIISRWIFCPYCGKAVK